MQLRICAIVASVVLAEHGERAVPICGSCGRRLTISAAAAACSRAMCSARAASRNVHHSGMPRGLPGFSTRLSGSRPAAIAISRQRSSCLSGGRGIVVFLRRRLLQSPGPWRYPWRATGSMIRPRVAVAMTTRPSPLTRRPSHTCRASCDRSAFTRTGSVMVRLRQSCWPATSHRCLVSRYTACSRLF